MKVKLMVARSGPKINQNAGDIVEVSDLEGERMIIAAQAEALAEPAKVSRAVKVNKSEKARKG